MRIEGRVFSISWIPSEAISSAAMKMPFEVGIAHYDAPLPDHVDDLEVLRAADAFRFANDLRAWIEVDQSGAIAGHGYEGGGVVGATTLRLGSRKATFAAVPYPDIQHAPVVKSSSVRFVQTAGGRTGAPAPRRVSHPPFVKISAPTAWSTLALTIHADGRVEHEVVGASPFPRHWVYDGKGDLVAKSGLIDFKEWARKAFGKHSPWGDEDSPALVAEAETALERQLSSQIMRSDTKPVVRKLKEGQALVEQGDEGRELFLVLDGILSVEVDGESVAEVGPGALLGERALLETGRRTSTLRARTATKVAVAAADDIDPALLAEVSIGHRREDG